jgi:NitT/TauT family transport system substrate-binding protein
VVVVLLLLAPLAAACSSGGPATAPIATPAQVATSAPIAKPSPARVNLVGSYFGFFAPVWVAQEKGYFAEQVVNVDLKNIYSSAADIMAALLGGSADIVAVSQSGTLQARENGADVRAVMALNRASETEIVIKRSTAEAHNIPDSTGSNGEVQLQALRGSNLKIAFPNESSSHYTQFLALLNLYGIPTGPNRDVDLVTVGNTSAQVAAFKSGQADGFGGLPPTTTLPKSDIVKIELSTVPPISKSYGVLLVTTDRMIRERPDAVQAVVTATVKGWKDVKDSPEQVRPLMAAMFNEVQIADPQVAASLFDQSQTKVTDTPALDMPGFDALLEVVNAAAAKPLTIAYTDVVDTKFVNKAIADLKLPYRTV